MLHKAWNSKGETPHCFPRSSVKFQGHTGKTSPILTQIGRFRTLGRSQLSNPSDLLCFSFVCLFRFVLFFVCLLFVCFCVASYGSIYTSALLRLQFDCLIAKEATLKNMIEQIKWIHWELMIWFKQDKTKHTKLICIVYGACSWSYVELCLVQHLRTVTPRRHVADLANVPLTIFRSNSKFD